MTKTEYERILRDALGEIMTSIPHDLSEKMVKYSVAAFCEGMENAARICNDQAIMISGSRSQEAQNIAIGCDTCATAIREAAKS